MRVLRQFRDDGGPRRQPNGLPQKFSPRRRHRLTFRRRTKIAWLHDGASLRLSGGEFKPKIEMRFIARLPASGFAGAASWSDGQILSDTGPARATPLPG